jgi:hypothetical protein
MSKGERVIRGMDGNEEKEQRHIPGEHEHKYCYAINVAVECRVFPSMPKGEIVDRLGWLSLMSTLEASLGSPRGVVKEPDFV